MDSQDRHDNEVPRRVVVHLSGTTEVLTHATVVVELPSTMTNEMLTTILRFNASELMDCAEWEYGPPDEFTEHDICWEQLEGDVDADGTATLVQDEDGEWMIDY
jgi:hypothetical protein